MMNETITSHHPCAWEADDLETFVLVVAKHKGHIPSKTKTKTEKIWQKISQDMKKYATNKNIESSTWSKTGLYEAYKDMRKKLFKEYNILEINVSQPS